MIKRVNEGNIWTCKDAQIILNPVSTGHFLAAYNTFDYLMKLNHKEVFDAYMDYIEHEPDHKLLGDIQLVKINNHCVVMNGFVYDHCRIHLKATAKVLIELYNLGREYELDVAIPLKMNGRNKKNIDKVEIIINTIFNDYENTVYLYENK